MSETHSRTRNFVVILLRIALVAALVTAVWAGYRRLPQDEHTFVSAGTGTEEQRTGTILHIHLRRADIGFPVSAEKIRVDLYPINMVAARNEFDSERRPGQRFEEFVTRLMGDRQPITTELDEHGETAIAVPFGKWWIHATVDGERELTWRLYVNVSGREKSVELTPDNAYTRAKKF
jgi:hypothetical protein